MYLQCNIQSMYAGAVTDIYHGQVTDVHYGHQPAVTTMYCWLFYASHHIVCGIDSMHMCDKYREGLPASSNLWEEMKSIVLLLPLWYNSGAASSKIRKTKNTLIEDYKTKQTKVGFTTRWNQLFCPAPIQFSCGVYKAQTTLGRTRCGFRWWEQLQKRLLTTKKYFRLWEQLQCILIKNSRQK